MVWNRYLVWARVHWGGFRKPARSPSMATSSAHLLPLLCSWEWASVYARFSWLLISYSPLTIPTVFKPAKWIHLPALDPRVGLPNMWLEPFTPHGRFPGLWYPTPPLCPPFRGVGLGSIASPSCLHGSMPPSLTAVAAEVFLPVFSLLSGKLVFNVGGKLSVLLFHHLDLL